MSNNQTLPETVKEHFTDDEIKAMRNRFVITITAVLPNGHEAWMARDLDKLATATLIALSETAEEVIRLRRIVKTLGVPDVNK